MRLAESYRALKGSIVAFVPKYLRLPKGERKPPFPPIFGTGIIVRDKGLVVTNDHVVKAMQRLYRPPEAPPEDWPAYVLLFKTLDEGVVQAQLDIVGVFSLEKWEVQGTYYGGKPDVGFVHIKARDLPEAVVDDTMTLEEGMEIATAGFPMGGEALAAPGWLHQITPTLQRGVISAVLPFPCPSPHGFAINVMTQGGASGSPVFLPDSGKVIGLLYAGLHDIDRTLNQKEPYRLPTNISYVVPSSFICNALRNIDLRKEFSLPADAMTIDQLISEAGVLKGTSGDRRPDSNGGDSTSDRVLIKQRPYVT